MPNHNEPVLPAQAPHGAVIRRLTIERFRGIAALSWLPGPGVNVILGGGDVGKTTILDAIGLLLSPTNAGTLSDTDYHARGIDAGFVIEAVISLPHESGVNNQVKASWPWLWNGTQPVVPAIDGDAPAPAESVYRLRAVGTEDLELNYEILQPDGTPDRLSVALRRSIGVVRLAGDDRSDRDLRLVQGSALDRLLSDQALRSRIASALVDTDVEETLLPAARDALSRLNDAFEVQGLPNYLDLGITGGPGPSIASLIGLTADRNGVDLPLTTWGAGTRRLAALAIAAQNQVESPITIVDEIERGLEPYRQRVLLEKLQAGNSQVFVTTHSPAVIAAASQARFWYVDHAGQIGPLDEAKIARHRSTDPGAFLARLAIIAEGKTEVGFVSALLEKALGSSPAQHGVRVSDGGGHEIALGLLEALTDGGVAFGGFVDDEGGLYPQRWRRVAEAQGTRLFRWAAGCLEQNIIGAVEEDQLELLASHAEHERAGARRHSLALRLHLADTTFAALRAAGGDRLKAAIIDASLGTVPDGTPDDQRNQFKSHAQIWFKSIEGGRELAGKVFSLRLWPSFRPSLLPFCNAVRDAIGLEHIADIEA